MVLLLNSEPRELYPSLTGVLQASRSVGEREKRGEREGGAVELNNICNEYIY